MANLIKYKVTIDKGVKEWGVDFTDSMAYLGDTTAMYHLAKGYRYYLNQHVPKKTGALRRSARPKGRTKVGSGYAAIYWGGTKTTEKYAHYQFVGDVYGPNKAIFEALGPNKAGPGAGVQSGWRSPKDKKKWNTNRKMGHPFTKTLKDGRVVKTLGYTTPGTGYDWVQRFKSDSGDNGERAVNVMAGRYMYELFCIHSRKTKLRGGRHVYNHWRQIENIRE